MLEALPSAPSFSEQQVHDLVNIVHSIMQQYLAPSNQTTPSSTPPAPQEAQKEEDEQLLQQTTVENITESSTESITESTTTHGSSVPDTKSTLSTIPRLCTAHSAACLSNTLLLACQLIMFLSTLFDYIEHSKGSEATGQG